MILQIDDLFIDTDNITTLSPYSNKIDNGKAIHGIIINGVRYLIITTSDADSDIEKGKELIAGVIATIINKKVQPVQRLNFSGEANDKA